MKSTVRFHSNVLKITNKKSYAVRFIFQDQEKTLQDQQIDGIMNRIREGLEKELGAELRG